MNICSEKKRNLKTFAVQKIKKVIHICRATQKWKKWTTFAVQKVKTNWKKHLQCKENKELRKKLHFWGIKALEKHQSEKKRWCFTTLWKNLQERSDEILAVEINLNFKLSITLELQLFRTKTWFFFGWFVLWKSFSFCICHVDLLFNTFAKRLDCLMYRGNFPRKQFKKEKDGIERKV